MGGSRSKEARGRVYVFSLVLKGLCFFDRTGQVICVREVIDKWLPACEHSCWQRIFRRVFFDPGIEMDPTPPENCSFMISSSECLVSISRQQWALVSATTL